jgi:hypothetical protein
MYISLEIKIIVKYQLKELAEDTKDVPHVTGTEKRVFSYIYIFKIEINGTGSKISKAQKDNTACFLSYLEARSKGTCT